MAKSKEDKGNTPAEKTLEGLLDMGVPESQAKALIQNTADWLGQAQPEGKADTSGDGDKPFEERGTKPFETVRDQGRIDLVKFIAETRMADGIEKLAPTSEIPAPMIMKMVRALSVDALNDNECQDTPAEVVVKYFLLLMKACNRKGMKELVQLFEMSEERGEVKDIFSRLETQG